MIEKMRKYTFLLYHQDYLAFLTELQKLGMVHVIRNTVDKSSNLLHTHEEIETYLTDIRFLKKWTDESSTRVQKVMHASQIHNQLVQAQKERERLSIQSNVLAKDIADLSPWGNFSYDLLAKLEQNGLKVDFFITSRNHFKPQWADAYTLQEVNQIGNLVYFTVVHKAGEAVDIDADRFNLPPRTLAELLKQETEVKRQIADIDTYYRNEALTAIDILNKEVEKLSAIYEYEDATLQAIPEAENHVMVLQGWIPKPQEANLLAFLNDKNIIYFASDANVEDNPPILLKNNWFAKLFEPIGKMFMLPYYNELDLTPFFAPFYMMFFGFCSGDAGYGLVLFIVGWLLKKKVKDPAVRPFLSLIQALGIGAVIMGYVMGSVFSYDLKTIPWLSPTILIKNTSQIFNFALLLGIVQILFGKILNAIKQMMQSGFRYGLATIGMVFFLLSVSIAASPIMGAPKMPIMDYTKYGIWLGLAMIMLLNSPGKNILVNLGNGLWVMYGVVTGFFGDLLSYIRLFALGVSGGILGIVVNSMASQMSHTPIIGPVLFLVMMVAGHGLNIALSSLGAFVHPMRLTFVEFFNNSGFSGPGLEYKPFGKSKQMIK